MILKKVFPEDIFDYVIGNSPYDAIEKQMTQTQRQVFELFDEFVVNVENSDIYPQSKGYMEYMKFVSNLKYDFHHKKMSYDETYAICVEIAEISPNHINLEFNKQELINNIN